MNIVVFGPPGVGKGTSSQILCAHLQIPKISTGDLLREEMDSGTSLGLKVMHIINSGNLVPDEMIIDFFKARIQKPDCAGGFITDGFPRTVEQAKALDGICKVDFVFNLIASQKSLLKRITGRRVCPECKASYNVNIEQFKPKKENICDNCGSVLSARADQEPSVVAKRLVVYDTQTKPVIAFYRAQKKLHDIDAEGSPQKIVDAMLSKLGK